MKQNYSDPMITYDEVVDAIKSIIDCTLNDNYTSDLNILNVKYDNEVQRSLDNGKEIALRYALMDLAKTINSSSKIIKDKLERELKKFGEDIFQINSFYILGREKRRLATNLGVVEKLRKASLPISDLYHAPYHEPDSINLQNVDTNKILSDFERKAIINFPDYFKEEIQIARNDKMHDLSSFEDMEKEDEHQKKIILIKKAINTARAKGEPELVVLLEKRLLEEMKEV